jgi:hypothetical protein
MTAAAMVTLAHRRRQAPRQCAPQGGFGALTAPARPSEGLPCRQCSLIILTTFTLTTLTLTTFTPQRRNCGLSGGS